MIIFRRKFFSRRDVFPENIRNLFEPNSLGNYKKIIIKTEESDEYKEQFKNSLETIRSRAKKYKDELRKNPLSRFEDAGNKFADTHYLSDYSYLNINNLKEMSVVFSKKLTNGDRFNYRIYLPEPREDENGEKILYQKIVLCSCWDHSLNGKPGSYVRNKNKWEGNTWHSPSKSTRNKKKKKSEED